MLGAASTGRPTGTLIADVVLRAAFAAAVVWFGGTGRRWTWFVLAGGAGALSRGFVPIGMAGLALVLAYLAAFSRRRARVIGGVICLISVELILRLPNRFGAPLGALVIGALCAPAVWSGYRVHGRRARRRIRAAAEILVVGAGLCLLGFGFAVIQGRSSLERGVTEARAALDAARAGNHDETVRRFDLATRVFEQGRSSLTAWWAKPALALPIFGQHARTISAVVDSGTDLVRRARDTAEVADYRRLRAAGGRIDLKLVNKYRAPVSELNRRLAETKRQLRSVSSPWLIPPLRHQVDSFATEVATAGREADLAAQVLAVAPDLLGGHGTRRYALLFVTPAETREGGGYMGNFGELSAVNGKLKLVRTGRSSDLNPATPQQLAARHLDTRGQPIRYRSYDVARYSGNVTGTQDFPTVARTFADLYPQAGGRRVDGAILVDPYGLAGLLKLTGPVPVKGLAQPLTSANAAAFLLKQQYVNFTTFSERVDYLGKAARATFEQLTKRNLPEPRRIAEALSPLTHSRRILAFSFHRGDRALLDRVGLSGEVPRPDGGDYLSVTNSNGNPDKIDAYLSRSISDDVHYDPRSGRIDAEVAVRLHNSAPTSGLPDYVIGNAEGLPKGTNRTLLSIYSGLQLESATLDDSRVGLEGQHELGHNRYTTFVNIPPGGTVTLRLRLLGRLRTSGQYRLTYLAQPVVNADQLRLRAIIKGRRDDGKATIRGSADRVVVRDGGARSASASATLTGGLTTFRVPSLPDG